jgi:rRNA maturation endonuclease Nob1
MTDGWIPLIIGTAVAIAALSYVLYPLLIAAEDAPLPGRLTTASARTQASVRAGNAGTFASRAEMAEDALREIEFDRETGKLSDTDYNELHAKYSAMAVVPVADAPVTAPSGAAAQSRDPVEVAVQRAQALRPVCATCGARPESDAQFCSECGRRLG